MQITFKAARVNANLTQEALAEKMGISRSLLIDLENGNAEMKPYYLYAFCHIVGLAEDDIFLPSKSTKCGLSETV